MRLGLAIPHYDFSFPDGEPATMARVVDSAARAEALGFDSVWVSDHLFLDLSRYGGKPGRRGSLGAIPMMAAIAARTSRVRVGSLVLCTPFRHAAVLAQETTSIDDLSEGRVELGIGAGWNEEEFADAGLPFGTPGERITALAAVASDLRARLEGTPIWVGGKGGPRIMRIVAESADGWNVVWRMTPDDYAQRLGVLRAACAEAGRDAGEVRLSVGLYTLLASDEADLADRYERMRRWAPGGVLDDVPLERFAEGGLVGTVERCAEIVRSFAALGVEEIILSPAPLPFAIYDDEQLVLATRDLAPLIS